MEKDKWEWPEFKQHLKTTTDTNEQQLPSLATFPVIIELNIPFHTLLNSMRGVMIEDSLERGALLCWWNSATGKPDELHSIIDDSDPAALLVASPLIIGQQCSIEGELFKQLEATLIKQGLSKRVSCLHSHSNHHKSNRFLSGGDIARMFDQAQVELLASSDQNLLALKSLQFKKITNNERHPNLVEVASNLDDFIPILASQTNIESAERSKYALYIGAPNQDLTRLYPPTQNPFYERLLTRLFPK